MCVCVCIYIYIYICLFIFIHIHKHVYIIRACEYMHTHGMRCCFCNWPNVKMDVLNSHPQKWKDHTQVFGSINGE